MPDEQRSGIPRSATCLLSSVLSFALAGGLALIFPSTWPLLAARIVLLCVGVALLVTGLRQRRCERASLP